MTVWASGPSYGLTVAGLPVVRIAGGNASVWRYARLATDASWKTIKRLVSSRHLILNPPPTFSHSENADWISFVFSSFGKPVKDKIRVTDAERPEVEAIDMFESEKIENKGDKNELKLSKKIGGRAESRIRKQAVDN